MSMRKLVHSLFSTVISNNKIKSNNSFLKIGARFYSADEGNYEYIKVSKVGEKKNVGLLQLNRPKALNAFCAGLMNEVINVLTNFDNDPTVGSVVITGNEKAFAAGADIKEMENASFSKWLAGPLLDPLAGVGSIRKPLIAAVNGYALGGGSELAMMCDIVYAGEKAKFGQPEINIGIVPGGGATQRLVRSVGKSKAMEMILTGAQVSAAEAEKMGLVSKVLPVDKVLDESIKLAEKIANNSHIINIIAKECVNAAQEMTLKEGIHFEKRMFHSCFATKDQKEGMRAFIEKRPAKFTNE